jgi:hypothetical protein
MKPALWLRISGVLLLLFVVGHTAGFLSFRPPTAEGGAVWEAMNNTHFSSGRGSYSYGDFYRGFGLFVSIFQLFAAWLAWTLGPIALQSAVAIRPIAWGLIAVQIASIILALRYFSIVQAILPIATALCLMMAVVSMRRIPAE